MITNLKLAQEIEGHKAANELGIPSGTLYTWIKAFKEGRLSANEAVHTPKNALCRETATPFELYRMGIEQLCDRRFSHCLKVLTENDRNRLQSLMEDGLYGEVLKYMEEHDVKLEQEIVSYYANRDLKPQDI